MQASSPMLSRFLKRLGAGAVCALLAACGGGGSSSPSSTTNTTGSTGGTSSGAVVVSISASPTTVTAGQITTLTWSASNASSCTAAGAWSGSLAASGTQSETPAATSTYTLTCGGVSNSTSVTVNPAPATTPTVSIALAPASITAGQSSVLTWSSTNATSCTASGSWSGAVGTSGTQSVTQSAAGSYPYAISCSNGTTSATGSTTLAVSAASAVVNSVTMTVDNGPSGGSGALNAPFVSVTVCQPGTTTCQTIDHVLVDTGSYGLRLLAPLNGALALPAVTTASGAAAAECGDFVSGYTWGPVRSADIKLGGETASSVPIQVIGDTSSPYGNVPASCTNKGGNLGTLSALGANGILGVGTFKQDCGSNCASRAVSGTYYACTGSGNGATCTPSTMPLVSQVTNPVSLFASDNNGVKLVLPSVPIGGSTTLTGTLIFGIGTQSNNGLGSATIYKVSSLGTFITVYKGQTLSGSFIDSGSNGYFFTDSSQRTCSFSSDFYCPSSVESLSATNSAFDNSATGTVNFTIENVDNLADGINAASIGGTNGPNSTAFDWGLPFFFGRPVYVGMEGTTAGAYWAY